MLSYDTSEFFKICFVLILSACKQRICILLVLNMFIEYNYLRKQVSDVTCTVFWYELESSRKSLLRDSEMASKRTVKTIYLEVLLLFAVPQMAFTRSLIRKRK